MFRLTSRHAVYAAAAFAAVALILPYQNCAGSGGGGAFNLTTTSASTAAPVNTTGVFTAGPVVLASTTVQVNAPLTASSSLTGAGSNVNVFCSWQTLTSANVAVGSPVVIPATNSSCTETTLTAPGSAGNYVLALSATNSSGTISTQTQAYTVQSAPVTVTATQSASLTPNPTTVIVNAQGALSAQIVASVAENLSAVIGTINTTTNVKTPFAGCSGSVSNQTILSVSCNESFSTAGTNQLYVDILVNGALVQTCTNNTTAGCQGTYSVVSYIYTPPSPPVRPPGGGCFVAGTLVETPHGLTPIEKIKKGDIVYTYDAKTKESVEGTVLATQVHKDKAIGEVELEDGTTLQVTSVHRFYLPKKKVYTEIGKLKVGDVLLRGIGTSAHEVKIKRLDFTKDTKATVYNFHVKKYMNYYVNGVLVHNVKIDPNVSTLEEKINLLRAKLIRR